MSSAKTLSLVIKGGQRLADFIYASTCQDLYRRSGQSGSPIRLRAENTRLKRQNLIREDQIRDLFLGFEMKDFDYEIWSLEYEI